MSATWSLVVNGNGELTRAKCVCTSGTETGAPSGAAAGINLVGMSGLSVHVEAAGAMTAGSLQTWLYNPQTGNWNRADANSMLDLSVTAGLTTAAFAGLSVDAGDTRIAFQPSGIGQACTVYLNASVK
jgi:hypothetical protein